MMGSIVGFGRPVKDLAVVDVLEAQAHLDCPVEDLLLVQQDAPSLLQLHVEVPCIGSRRHRASGVAPAHSDGRRAGDASKGPWGRRQDAVWMRENKDNAACGLGKDRGVGRLYPGHSSP